LELDKRNIQRNLAECVQLRKNVKTPDISATHAKSPCIKERRREAGKSLAL
jgi:hypothetical protein